MSDESDIVGVKGDYRVRMFHDPYAEAPEDDGMVPMLTIIPDNWGGYRAEGFNDPGKAFVAAFDKLAELDQGYSTQVFERYLRIFHGTKGIAEYGINDTRATDYEYIGFDTDAWAEKVGCPDEHRADAAKTSMAEVRAWVEGDTWGWKVEEKVTGRKVYDNGSFDEPFIEWELIESCSGYYGRKYAEEAATEALKELAND